jgi:hypothetical protein
MSTTDAGSRAGDASLRQSSQSSQSSRDNRKSTASPVRPARDDGIPGLACLERERGRFVSSCPTLPWYVSLDRSLTCPGPDVRKHHRKHHPGVPRRLSRSRRQSRLSRGPPHRTLPNRRV